MSEITLRQFSMFDSVGGEATVDRLVESFYAQMDALAEARTIRAMHARDLGRTKDILKRYLGEWMGGPKRYSAERGHPRLRGRHIGFKIGEAERDAWLECMTHALDESIADPEARLQILGAFEHLANWMRNEPGNPHDSRNHNA